MKARILEITLWFIIAIAAPLLLSQICLLLAGNQNRDINPEISGANNLSDAARRLIKKAYQDVDPKTLTDYHVHIAGVDRKKNGNYINQALTSPFSPRKFIIFKFFQDAFGLKEMKNADELVMARLSRLIKALPVVGKFSYPGDLINIITK